MRLEAEHGNLLGERRRVEQAAAEEGVSVNSWFVRAIAAALEPGVRRAPRRETKQGDSFTGWAR